VRILGRELKNANITHVSYVDKAANQKKFFLTKSANQPNFEKNVQILTKSDDAQQLVYGVVYEPGVLDIHGDFMTAAEIEKAAHAFMKDYQNIDTQHNFEAGAGELVESYVVQADMEIGGETITKGSWVIVTKATDEVWESIQKGDITGYSMAGKAETVEDAEVTKAKSLMKIMKEFFLGETEIAKGEVTDKFNAGRKQREFFDALYIFEDVFYNEIWSAQPDTNRLKDAAVDFADLLTSIANSQDIFKALGELPSKEEAIEKSAVMKAGKKISSKRLAEIKSAYEALGNVIADAEDDATTTVAKGEEDDMKKEDVLEVMKEALAPITAKLEALEKSNEDTTEEVAKATETASTTAEAAVTKEELSEVLKSVLGPIADRLETVEKARGIKKAADDEQPAGEEIQKSVWDGLFTLSRNN
jgi:hypothetical protein